jgi:hypothetical protein
MYATSRRFLDALSGSSQTVATKAELLIDGELAVDLTAEGLMADGEVQVQDAVIHRSGSLTLTDHSGVFLPTRPDDLLAPTGGEIRPWRGLSFPDGTVELVPLGTFRYTGSRGQWPRIDLDLFDRSWAIAGAKLETAMTILAGTNVVEAVSRILTAAVGAANIEMNFPTTDEVTPTMVLDVDTDPWETAAAMTANIGRRLVHDQWGVCTMRTVQDPNLDPPVWTFDDADVRNMALPGLEVSWDSGESFNAVVVIAENSDNGEVYRGVARDSDPTSPTLYDGPFGRRPRIVRDETITSSAQAEQRARAILLAELGNVQTIVVPSLVHPALEGGDLVRVRDRRRDIDEVVLVDRFTIPLRASSGMQIERARRVPVIA